MIILFFIFEFFILKYKEEINVNTVKTVKFIITK